MSKQSKNTALPVYAAVGAAAVIAAVWIIYQKTRGEPSAALDRVQAAQGALDASAPDDSITDEEERLKYVASSIEIVDLAVGQDQRPDDSGPVKGLLRVSGRALNKGNRAVRELNLVVHPMSATGKVLGTYLEDILHHQRLGPTESKTFKFEIPEKPEFSGKLMHEVR